MSVIVRVSITNDSTGEVTKEFIQTYDGSRYDFFDWIKSLMARVTLIAFGSDEDWK